MKEVRTRPDVIPEGWSRVWTGDDWATPRWLVEAIRGHYGEITLDPCWNAHAVTEPMVALTIEDSDYQQAGPRGQACALADGLSVSWRGASEGASLYRRSMQLVFVNPPYSEPAPWFRKAVEESQTGLPVLLLVKLDPTRAFHEALAAGAHLGLFRRRLAHVGADGKEAGGSNVVSCLLSLGEHVRPLLAHPDVVWRRA